MSSYRLKLLSTLIPRTADLKICQETPLTEVIKVKQSLCRTGQVLRVSAGWGFQISRQSPHEGGRFVRPLHRLPLPPRKFSWYSYLLDAESGLGHTATGNRTRDLPACITMPRHTAPPRAQVEPHISSEVSITALNDIWWRHVFHQSADMW